MIRRLAVAFAFAVLADAPLFAASPVSTSFTAKVQVNGNCSITSAGTLDFATYDPLTANATSAQPGSTTLSFKCTRGSHPIISMGPGSNASGTQRNMITGSGGANNTLGYNLVQPTGATFSTCASTNTAWGDGTAATTGSKLDFGVTSVGPSTGLSVTICGYIPGGQDVNAGTFQDSVLASVEF
jgi:spore coat protein U-like protein